MSLPPSTSKKSYTPNLNKIGGAKKGKLYEIISLLKLAGKGYKLSTDENTKFGDFSIGREVGIGKYRKFDDVVFSYVDQENRKNLIFLQLKHCQYSTSIDSSILSTEADTAKDVADKAKASATRVGDVRYGYMCKNFNLQQYFISFLSARDELGNTETEELKDGEIKYVVLFTNSDFDIKELEGKGFSFNKAPDDIVDLFALSSEAQHYQLGNVSEDLRKILEKSSDLDRLARELARYVIFEDYRKNRIMGIQETPIKYYHVALEKEVIRKSPLKQVEKGQYFREAQFRDDFLDCDPTSPNLRQLRKVLFEAIRDLDESKKNADDDELKRVIKQAKWKIVYNCDKSIQTNFPCEWIPVRDDDIKDFLRYFVFMVNQPTVSELELLYKQSIQCVVVENTSLKQFVDQINATGPEFRDSVEKVFGLDIKLHNDEKWIPRNQIQDFMKKKQRLLHTIFVVSAMTLMYKNEIMQYGKFNDFGKMTEDVKNFLTSDCKILCFNTPVTLLSSIKMSQHVNAEKKYPISLSLNILNSIENIDCVLKAFELESTSLLTIECRHAFKDQDFDLFEKLFSIIAKTKSNKKIILIMQEENCNIFTEHFKNEGICVIENDSIELKDFEPKEDPLAKKVLVFQGQKEKISLSDITGIDSWPSYVHSLSQGINEQGLIDGMTLVEILSNDEIKVGSKPAGTSSLEGAYAQMYEEINVENLVDRLTSQEHGNDTNDLYIISGINGSSKQDKTNKLIQYLGEDNENREFKNRLEEFENCLKTFSVPILKVVDDPFKDEDFNKFCHNYPEKRIFWICLECEINTKKFVLQGIYNPEFYLKRKFKNVIIKKDLKQQLIKDDLSEIFIFHCAEDKQELFAYMELNAREMEQIEHSCMIKIFSLMKDAEDDFKERSKQNITVHLIEFEGKQFIWWDSHGSLYNLLLYIDKEKEEDKLIEEDNVIRKIKDRKVVIFADDPGMGKTTTLIKLYETEIESSSIIKSHWVISIKLRDHLDAVRALEFKKYGNNIASLVKFLLKIDLKLNDNLAKNLLKIALDKNENIQAKSLLLTFDGFDEVLDEDDRNRILLLIKFIKNKTAAKLWITTRCHFKTLLEEEFSTIAFQFSPMGDAENAQYIAKYLQHRLYLILNKEKYSELFDTNGERQNNEKIPMYASAFINKMQSIFKGDIETFIGTPLQLYLMLEYTVGDFKNWIRRDGGQIPDLKYVHNDVCEIYEHFVKRKYDVYFQKRGIREHVQQKYEKLKLDQYHKKFAVSKIYKKSSFLDDDFEHCKDIFLLVGVIKSQGNDLEFIHKTFEEFFASKAFIDWIRKAPKTGKQEYLLKVILLKADYRLVRTFMNHQLQKLSEQSRKDERPNELDKSQENLQLQKLTEQARHDERLKHYGDIALTMHNKQLLVNEDGETPLDFAVKEGNKSIARFLLNILRGQPDVLTDFLFNSVGIDKRCPYVPGTPLHLACQKDDVEIVRILIDAAAGISEDTLQKFLRYLNDQGENALTVAARCSHNVQIFNELLSRSNNKLDLILNQKSALCMACCFRNEKFVEFLLGEFKNEDCLENGSLKKILLQNGKYGNMLCCAMSTTTIIEKLVSAAKSMKDNNETLKNLLFPEEGRLPLYNATSRGEFEIVEKLLNVAKEIDDDTLKQLLLNETHGESALHVAARYGYGDIINLLLETASNIDIEILEKLITAVNIEGKNAIDLMFQYGHGKTFVDSFKMLQEEKYENIRKKVKEMYDNVPFERTHYSNKKTLIMAIEHGDIETVKYILNKVKNSSVNPNESLRFLLLSKNKRGNSTLYTACKEGNTEIMKELLSYAKENDDDTLKQLLLHERYRRTPLHIAAEHGKVHIINLLLETASNLDIEIVEKLITAVDEEGKNAIELMFQYGHRKTFADSFKMLQEDKYENIRKKVKEMFDNVPLEIRLCPVKKMLIMAIEFGDIQKVKDVLYNAKNSSFNPNERLRFLLLSKSKRENSTLHTACEEGNTEIMKELLSYAKEIDDDTLKQLLLHERCGSTPLHVAAEHGKVHIINLLLETASNLDIEILEKLITAVDEKGKNAIELMFQYGHGDIFVDSFKMFQEDKYENIRKKVKEMYNNVPLETRLCPVKKLLIIAIERGDIRKVKDILSNAKNSSLNPNERLRILLLSKNECDCSTLYIACKEGNSEIIEDLISYAKEIDDDNHTLKQLLLLKRNEKSALHVAAKNDYVDITKLLLETASALDIDDDNHTLKQLLSNKGYGDSALHVAAKKGHVNITKLLLETASGLGIDILEELIFHVNEKGKNAIQLIAEHGPETVFVESFKMLKDEYPIILEKVMEMYDNIPFERTLYSNKKTLNMAIERGDIETVKDILNKVKNSSVNPNESLRFLLLSKSKRGNSTLHTACEEGNTEIMKELLSYAKEIDDDTLKQLLLHERYGITPLHVAAEHGKVHIINLLLETASNLDIEILEKLITAVDEEGKNAIVLICQYGYGKTFADFFNMLLEDKYENIRKEINEMFKNVPLKNKHYWDKEKLIMAIEFGDIQKVKEVLSNAKNSLFNPNERLRFLLFSKKRCGNTTLHTACEKGNTEIMKELLSYAKEIDDDTLRQLLLQERYGSTPLHVAAEHGKVHIINLLLETASNLDIEILEKLITAVDMKGKNAIELMFQYGHGDIFVESFKILQEDKYENIRKKVKEMYDNVPLETRLCPVKEMLIMAIERGDIQKVKDILSNVKNSSLNPNERLRISLLSKNECGCSTLYIACKEGNSEIIEDLISYAKEIDDDNHTLKRLLLLKRNGKSALHVAAKKDYVDITKLLLETASALDIDDDNHTLKQLLSNKGYGDSALHVAAKKGHVNITKLLLETASGLGIDILEELIFHVNEKGKNAIQLIAEHGHESIFAKSFKMLKDEYPIIWEKVMEMYDNIPFERTLYSNKKKLIVAIERGDIETVKDILNKVKNSSVDPNESLRFLLLSKNIWSNNTLLHTVCIEGSTEIMKELLSYAMNMDDGGATLKELLTKPTDMSPLTPLKELKHGYAREIKQIVDSLIVEARNNNRDHAVNILEKIDNQYSEEISSSEESDDVSEEMIYEDSFNSSSSSEESDDVLEAWVPV